MTADARMISRLFFRLLPIQILLAVVGTVGGIVSSLFASNLVGSAAMSAIGLYGPIGMFLGSVSLMLIGGAQILCGKYMGRDQLEHTQQVFSLDLTVAFGFCALFSVLFLLLGLFNLTGLYYRDPGESVYRMTVWAFRILPLCMPFSVFCMNFVCYGQSADKQLLVHVESALDGVVCVAGFSALLVPRIGLNVLTITV